MYVPDWLQTYTELHEGVGLREREFIQKVYDYSRPGEQFLYDLSRGGRMWINARFTDEAQLANKAVFMAIMRVVQGAKSEHQCREEVSVILNTPYVQQVLGESCGYNQAAQAAEEIIHFCVRHNFKNRALRMLRLCALTGLIIAVASCLAYVLVRFI